MSCRSDQKEGKRLRLAFLLHRGFNLIIAYTQSSLHFYCLCSTRLQHRRHIVDVTTYLLRGVYPTRRFQEIFSKHMGLISGFCLTCVKVYYGYMGRMAIMCLCGVLFPLFIVQADLKSKVLLPWSGL